jgi:Cu-Zn family superoxide dismutase
MKKLIPVLFSGLFVFACSEDNKTTETTITTSTGAWTVFPQTGGAANPAQNIMGSAKAVKVGTDKMRVEMTLTGLPVSTTFGSHIHKLDCATMTAGGHYQHMPSGDAAATDPAFGNATNEVWLDFMTDTTGKATVSKESTFIPRAGEAKAIVVHAMATMPGGVAGAKLACLAMPF